MSLQKNCSNVFKLTILKYIYDSLFGFQEYLRILYFNGNTEKGFRHTFKVSVPEDNFNYFLPRIILITL